VEWKFGRATEQYTDETIRLRCRLVPHTEPSAGVLTPILGYQTNTAIHCGCGGSEAPNSFDFRDLHARLLRRGQPEVGVENLSKVALSER